MKFTTLLALIAALLIACTTSPASKTEAAVLETTEATLPADFNPDVRFTAEDLEGSTYTEAIFASNTITILNFWEPWCGPCVMEMPDLEKISQDYADKGVQILGIYATPDAEEDVAAVLESTGVTYPILHYTHEFDFLMTGYVPTTVIVDAGGKLMLKPFATALAYEQWATLIDKLLAL